MMTILIADDEPAIVDLVRFTLEDPHVQIVDAADGAAALELARRERPDVALLDVQMPRLNGLDVCRQLRRLPECAHTRVVMLTAAAQAADRRRGPRGGRRSLPDQALLAARPADAGARARAGGLDMAGEVGLSQALSYARDLKSLYESSRAREQELEQTQERLRAAYQQSLQYAIDLRKTYRRLQQRQLPEPARPGQRARGQGRLHARALRARRGARAADRARGRRRTRDRPTSSRRRGCCTTWGRSGSRSMCCASPARSARRSGR